MRATSCLTHTAAAVTTGQARTCLIT